MSFAPAFSRFRRICRALLLVTACLLPAALRAQSPGTLDTNFLSVLTDSTVFALTDEVVTTYMLDTQMGVPPNTYTPTVTDYVAAGGDMAAFYIEGDPATTEGGLEIPNFKFPSFGNINRIIYTVVPEIVPTFPGSLNTDERMLLVGGAFGKTQVDKDIIPTRNIERVSAIDGTIDTSFDPGVGADDFVTSILPLSDGTMMVGGLFSKFNKENHPRLVRLNHDGSLDADYQQVPMDDGVFALASELDPATGLDDGKILVGGVFSTIGGNAYTKLARIDAAGNLDTTFRPNIDARVLAIAAQPDGKIVIGGEFSLINGQTVGHIARLNQDGSLDTTFNASVSMVPVQTTAPVAVYVLKLLPDGRLYVGGQFSAVDGVTRNYLARIESDGNLDTSFDPGANIINSVQSLAVDSQFRVLVGETLSKAIASGIPPTLIRLYGGTAPTLEAIYIDVPKAKARLRANGKRKTGQFVINRTGDVSVPLTVYFQETGTAQTNVDFKSLKGAATIGLATVPVTTSQFNQNIYALTIPAGSFSATIKVRPLAETEAKTLVITLVPSQDGATPYEVGKLFENKLYSALGVGLLKIGTTK